MQTYSCKVRLHNDLYNEVRKYSISAAEVMVLKYIHGGEDSVVDIVPDGKIDRTDREERDHLRQTYSFAPEGSLTGDRIDIVSRLFGPDTLPLPKQLEGIEHPDVVTEVPQKRVRRTEPAEASVELLDQ
ncbi:hypothetical protein [Rhodoligotrophos defluvii]|uniref:hypothetical protein n=1 Tax=Rhodoligotrophos defluvii TaxID=2561934 RepID=UPI0010C9AFEC|nr:hypothetical protein [Rhodoligotrophos defluvii]